MKKSIALLSKSNIISGKLKRIIPEFYDLKNVVENNHWHNKESVFDHTFFVLNNLEKTSHKLDKRLKRVLNSKVDKNTRIRLLKIATIFHDIVKEDTMINKNGITMCPNHEEKGARQTKEILKRFEISSKESNLIVNIVKYHGLFYHISKKSDKDYKTLKRKFLNTIYLELMLLIYADTLGSYLKTTQPVKYKSRINFYKKELK